MDHLNLPYTWPHTCSLLHLFLLFSSIVCFCNKIGTLIRVVIIILAISMTVFCPEEPNKTKPPLQVLAVVERNIEKIRFGVKHMMEWNTWWSDHTWNLYKTLVFSYFLSTTGLESGRNQALKELNLMLGGYHSIVVKSSHITSHQMKIRSLIYLKHPPQTS